MYRKREAGSAYLRNFIFGVEDSLVSTTGLLAGIATAGVPSRTILITGSILVVVEAFSMAVGSFLSEQSAAEYEQHAGAPLRQAFMDSIIMFVSYLLAGSIPLFPFFALQPAIAMETAIVLSLLALFILGALSGTISKTRVWKSGLRMFLVGGIAVAVGMFVGGIAM